MLTKPPSGVTGPAIDFSAVVSIDYSSIWDKHVGGLHMVRQPPAITFTLPSTEIVWKYPMDTPIYNTYNNLLDIINNQPLKDL